MRSKDNLSSASPPVEQSEGVIQRLAAQFSARFGEEISAPWESIVQAIAEGLQEVTPPPVTEEVLSPAQLEEAWELYEGHGSRPSDALFQAIAALKEGHSLSTVSGVGK